MGKTLAIFVVAVVLLTAGAILLVHRLTEPQPPGAGGASAAPAGTADDPVARGAGQGGAAYQSDAGSPVVVPARPVPPGPVQNEAPPIQGRVPVAFPADATERADAFRSIRQRRREEQMERLNRRNQERLGGSGGNAARPPPPDPD